MGDRAQKTRMVGVRWRLTSDATQYRIVPLPVFSAIAT
jgi:hypothetical protein